MQPFPSQFAPRITPLTSFDLPEFPLEGMVEQVLARQPVGSFAPTGMTRADYLDIMEIIVAAAIGWQDKRGAIIDPVRGKEWGQTTSRFAASGAVLLAFDRMPSLLPQVTRAMDWVCSRLPRGRMDSPDFQTREIMTAYFCLQGRADPANLRRWADGIRAIEPEKVYKVVSPGGEGMEKLHNWNLYGCAGEVMRQQAGLGPEGGFSWGDGFFHKYAPVHLSHHFTAWGMYRDPNDPITYDIQARLQLAIALAYGYQGPLREPIEELLRRGALTTLLFLTPDGLVPFGGRSDQFHFREAAVAALCELEAARYRKQNPPLAGAFKRQAHRSVLATRRWLVEMQPLRHLKNSFPPSENWGTDSYGFYSVYSLLTASMLGLAALFADDSIEEAPCPAEIGSYTFALQPAFHKVFSNCRGTYLAFDTAADPMHNATGLGSFQRAGVPTETALAMPFSADPHYNLKHEFIAQYPAAIAPSWKKSGVWISMAELSEGLEPALAIEEDSPGAQSFGLRFQHGQETITLRVRLSEGSARLDCTAPGAEGMRFTIPLLHSNGADSPEVNFGQDGVRLRHLGAEYRVGWEPGCKFTLHPAPIANRNGLYRLLELENTGSTMSITFELKELS